MKEEEEKKKYEVKPSSPKHFEVRDIRIKSARVKRN
jgi:hypothetical protein